MNSKIKINYLQLYNDLMYLLQTPGPTQACVKSSEDDPRIKGNFPIEKCIEKIINEHNKQEKLNLQIIRHNGNLLIVGGMEEKFEKIIDAKDMAANKIEDIKKIPIIFGAHLDEICYMIQNKRGFLKGENYKVLPICAPPTLPYSAPIYNKKNTAFAQELYHPESKIVGFRNGKFCDNIGTGILYRVVKIKKTDDTTYIIDGKGHDVSQIETKPASYLILKILTKRDEIKPGDIVIQDYGDWKDNKSCNGKNDVITSKALDDRLGCIAVIYAVRELAKRKIPSKAILTSAEEGVPRDASWGRLVRSGYKLFCEDTVITLVCDGVDGLRLSEFEGEPQELSKAVIIPYTSDGKGGGDLGVFSRYRDNILPDLKRIYGEDVAVITTDYSSRSFEIKIMDDWTTMGFVQWSCGKPMKKTSICHNHERVCLYQIINIIRTLCHSFEFFSKNKS